MVLRMFSYIIAFLIADLKGMLNPPSLPGVVRKVLPDSVGSFLGWLDAGRDDCMVISMGTAGTVWTAM